MERAVAQSVEYRARILHAADPVHQEEHAFQQRYLGSNLLLSPLIDAPA